MHVASTAASITSVWLIAGMGEYSENPHELHVLVCIPGAVQEGGVVVVHIEKV